MIDPSSRTRFHPELNLETWHPIGILDYAMAMEIVNYVTAREKILDQPFNRFADLTGVTEIDLDFAQVHDLAQKRCAAYAGHSPVKTAFLATDPVAYGIARMFGTLMESSPIHVEVFREIVATATWLRVPVGSLRLGP